MKKSDFIAEILPILERLAESTQGIADWMGEETPDSAATDIAALVPSYVWENEESPSLSSRQSD